MARYSDTDSSSSKREEEQVVNICLTRDSDKEQIFDYEILIKSTLCLKELYTQ